MNKKREKKNCNKQNQNNDLRIYNNKPYNDIVSNIGNTPILYTCRYVIMGFLHFYFSLLCVNISQIDKKKNKINSIEPLQHSTKHFFFHSVYVSQMFVYNSNECLNMRSSFFFFGFF